MTTAGPAGQYPAYVPTKLSPLSAQLLNVLCTRNVPWHFSVGNTKAEVRPAPFSAPFTPVCGLVLNCGGAFWRAELGGEGILRRHPALADIDPNAQLPAPAAMAILTAAAQQPIEVLGQFLGIPVAIHAAARIPAASPEEDPFAKLPPSACTCDLEIVLPADNLYPAETIPLRIGLPNADAAMALANRLASLPCRSSGGAFPSAVFSGIPVPVSIVAAEMRLSSAELSQLETGDILFPESYPLANGQVFLRYSMGNGIIRTVPCSLKDGMAAAAENITAAQEHPMSEQETAARGDIEVTLSFELEHRLMTLSDLETLAPGYTFALAADQTAPVTLRANGKAIGRGRLVDMNGSLGVQITELK